MLMSFQDLLDLGKEEDRKNPGLFLQADRAGSTPRHRRNYLYVRNDGTAEGGIACA